MISYCLVAFRPWYALRLIQDLIRKTTVPYEILVWLNLHDPEFERFLAGLASSGHPLQILGKTPANIGMTAYATLFRACRHTLIVQMDDDVVAVTPRIAEIAADLFARFPVVKQLVADVWQDEFTTGARPEWTRYRAFDAPSGLYEGPIDGWFSVYHRSALPLLLARPYRHYFPLGATIRSDLARRGWCGVLCTKFKVFHVIGPVYAAHFGGLDFEIEKYRRLGRVDIVRWYENARRTPVAPERLRARLSEIEGALNREPS